MLNSFCKGICASAVAITLLAGVAHAGNHNVLIEEGGFFPPISYVAPGDNLVFTNNSEFTHTITGPDDSWASQPIPAGGTFVLHVSAATPMSYSSVLENYQHVTEDGEIIDSDEDYVLSGEFTFDPAPLDDFSE